MHASVLVTGVSQWLGHDSATPFRWRFRVTTSVWHFSGLENTVVCIGLRAHCHRYFCAPCKLIYLLTYLIGWLVKQANQLGLWIWPQTAVVDTHHHRKPILPSHGG